MDRLGGATTASRVQLAGTAMDAPRPGPIVQTRRDGVDEVVVC